MAIWDNVSNFISGNGQNTADRGYREADRYLSPYAEGGLEDYRNLREYNDRWSQGLGKYDHAGDRFYDEISLSPAELYAKRMEGYTESPMAKYQQEQALRASKAAGAASGMIGSGAFLKGIQQNASDIVARDQDRYFNNILATENNQRSSLNNLQQQRANQLANQQYLATLGYGANTARAGNAIDRGNTAAKYRSSAMDDLYGLGAAAYQKWVA
jgi:hypothetical protein